MQIYNDYGIKVFFESNSSDFEWSLLVREMSLQLPIQRKNSIV